MEKIFDEVATLDKKCYDKFGLNEDILMEHAANSIKLFIEKKFKKQSSILIVSGVGNNGADGITLARLLEGDYRVVLFLPFEPKSKMAKLQLKRANSVGVKVIKSIDQPFSSFDVVVDCLFGSGLSRKLDNNSLEIIEYLNCIDGYKIACDIPSGILNDGTLCKNVFKADTTITMGALKKSLFNDLAKDMVGEIIVANLGVSRGLYENETDTYLLEKNDIVLPLRNKKNTHKGDFGHLAVIVGDKKGAGVLCADAAFNFGVGLVTIITKENLNNLPYHIMQSSKIPKNTTAIAIGMGLGEYDEKEICSILDNDIPKVIDADLFSSKDILRVLDKKGVVLTPHPKEFCSLLKLCGIADIKVEQLQEKRFYYVERFCNKYPNIVLLLKGSNVLIGKNKQIFVNPLGSSKLSFGGSGDVLAGLIASLLAQGYDSLNATINGTLAHTIAANNFSKNNYSMTPQDLIDGVKTI